MRVWILKTDEGADGEFRILGVFSSASSAEDYARRHPYTFPDFDPRLNLEEHDLDDPCVGLL